MDISLLRSWLNEVLIIGNNLLEPLRQIEVEKAAVDDAALHLEQFSVRVTEALIRVESQAKQSVMAARSCLERFTRLSAPNEAVASLLHIHQIAASERLDLPLDDDIEEFTEPYALFLKVIDQPDRDVPQEEGARIETHFGWDLARPLYQAKFRLASENSFGEAEQPTSIPAGGERPDVLDEDETPAEPLFAPDDCQPPASVKYAIKSTKPNATFSTKSFVKDYCSSSARQRGIRVLAPQRMGELHLIHLFARMGALTRRQLKYHIFSCGLATEDNFERLLSKGYLAMLTPVESGEVFFALSRYGSEIFEKETSRELMAGINSLSFLPPIWIAETCLAAIEAAPAAYERIATVALSMMSSASEDCDFKRLPVDMPELSCVALFSSSRPGQSKTVFGAIIPTDDEVMIGVPDQPFHIQRGSLDWLADPATSTGNFYRYYAQVSEDQAGVEFSEATGDSIELEELLLKMAGLESAASETPEIEVHGQVSEPEKHEGPPDSEPHSQVLPSDGPADGLKCESESDNVAEESAEAESQAEHEGVCPEPEPVAVAEEAAEVERQSVDEGVTEPESVDMAGEVAEAESLSVDEGISHERELCGDSNPFSLANKILAENIQPTDDRRVFDSLIDTLLRKASHIPRADEADYLGRAVALLKALALADPLQYDTDYRRLLLATDLPVEERHYKGEVLVSLFQGEAEGSARHLAALLRALFAPEAEHDHQLYSSARNWFENYDVTFDRFPELKTTLNDFLEINAAGLTMGFSEKVVGRFLNTQTRKEACGQLLEEVRRLQQIPRISQRLSGLPDLLNNCFGPNSCLGKCLGTIAANQEANRSTVEKSYDEFLDKGSVSEEIIKTTVEETWKKIRSNKMVKEIVGDVRDKLIGDFQDRLKVIGDWLNLTEDNKTADEKDRRIYTKIQLSLKAALQAMRIDPDLSDPDRTLLQRALANMQAKLERAVSIGFTSEDWLSTGLLALKPDGTPTITKTPDSKIVPPWLNVLRHIAQKPQDLREVLDRITKDGDELFDNLNQAVLICQHLAEKEQAGIFIEARFNAEQMAEKQRRRFLDELELDFACARVDENTRELVRSEMDNWPLELWDHDFARFRRFLGDLRLFLQAKITEGRDVWMREIEARQGDRLNQFPEQGIFLTRAENYLRDGYFILAEDALNDFDAHADPDQAGQVANEDDLFQEFIDETYNNGLYEVCRRNRDRDFRAFAPDWAERKLLDRGLSQRYLNSAKRLTSSLPNMPQVRGENDVKILLEELGFVVKSVLRKNGASSPAQFTADMEPVDKNLATYGHPIAAFGTKLPSKFSVVELFGSLEPVSIGRLVPTEREAPGIPIIFLNGALSLQQRRQLAALFLSCDGAPRPYILIDWVLLLHLATHVREKRLQVLLACSLPFTGIHQVFSSNSMTSIDDEMFIGRTREISAILDLKGPVIVYGGRQLGKTALLFRAKNRFHAPEKNDYGVFVDIKNCHDEKSLAKAVTREMATSGIKVPECDSLATLCRGLRKWFQNAGEGASKRLLLLMDESDDLLEGLAKDDYAPLVHLENLGRDPGGAAAGFKFVFAGLHNVVRAAKGANTIFGHFGQPLAIRPLSPTDAFKLLTRPLVYLGFTPERNPLLLLLVNTIFYPGVVHYVGTALVELLTNNYNVYYRDKGVPPFELSERQIANLIHSQRLTELIDDRVRLTLGVAPAYFNLARCIALLDYYEMKSSGYSVEQILRCGEEFKGALTGLDREKCQHLLSELCDMSILAKTDDAYRFRLSRFRTIVGKSFDDVWAQLDGLSHEGQ